jgi:probable DNA metabolism protein
MQIALDSPVDVLGFRAQANTLLARQVQPADVGWQAAASADCGETLVAAGHAAAKSSALHAIVPRSFVRLTELVVLHRSDARFGLLYRLLWRLVHEPELLSAAHDQDMALAQSMAQAVRRDILRARKAMRMRLLPARAGASAMRVAWIEPQHHVTEQVAQDLTRLQLDQPWLLASPDRCLLWNGSSLLHGPGVAATRAAAADDALWYAQAQQIAAGSQPRTP